MGVIPLLENNRPIGVIPLLENNRSMGVIPLLENNRPIGVMPLLENNRSIFQGGGNRGSIVKGIHINIHNDVMTVL